MQNLIKFHQFVHKILRGNEILTITKSRNHVVNLRKLTSNVDLANVNAYATFGLIPQIRSQDSEWKRSRNHGMTDKLKTIYPPFPLPHAHTWYAGGIKTQNKVLPSSLPIDFASVNMKSTVAIAVTHARTLLCFMMYVFGSE